jgi:hypothetical protein
MSLSLDYSAQRNVIEGALTAPSPSSAAVLNGFLRGQEKCPIWNGRPSMNRGIPIQLYHPSFAKFLRVARTATGEIDLTPEDYSATHSLFHSSAMLYKDEAKRVEGTRVFLDKAIRRAIPALDVPGMKADGACQVFCGNLYALAAAKEDKNEIGTGGCDPSHQCALDFRLYYAKEEVRPFLPFFIGVLVSHAL